ncbi:DUF4307 domain-containing protein [Allokutzneria sp. A3M-2-11 16]|uniref:DUF4307 domain-containing protein n=1 Tax=Allokutzneria sp. A3M-2-11 16 TaxID=2962043 RepID=UPI0020B8894E|nr:DUF4307 domain-containing protein [Allokutzneria sp. A3M-2-11 16]MCP3798694.1 DUF4307 domain-containing protein [Allokutzneria sp. A3M-2-11 16]
MSEQALPPGRYGRDRDRRMPRWAQVSLLVFFLSLGVAVTVVGFLNLGTQPISTERTAFTVLDDANVKIDFQVIRDEPERAAACVVRARSADGDEVGRKEVYVPPARDLSLRTTVIRTSKRPVTGEVFGCSYQVPEYLAPTPRPSG